MVICKLVVNVSENHYFEVVNNVDLNLRINYFSFQFFLSIFHARLIFRDRKKYEGNMG